MNDEYSGRLSERMYLDYYLRHAHSMLLDSIYAARILATIALKTLVMSPILIAVAILIILDWIFD